MGGDRYSRPRLCRLCECPAALDGGLKINRPILDKLSRWWKAHWNCDLEQKPCTVCYFCIWELRFAEENSREKEPRDQRWWPICEKRSRYFRYFKEDLLKPCFVQMRPLAADSDREEVAKRLSLRHKCPHCPSHYSIFETMRQHIRKNHPERFFPCGYSKCSKLLQSEAERSKHIKTDHLNLKCKICGIESVSSLMQAYHMRQKHNAQKCSVASCGAMLASKLDRKEHWEKCHRGRFFCCFCDVYFSSYKIQWHHIKTNHKEAIKCDATRMCPNYFKTEQDMRKHIEEDHANKKTKCIYCENFYKNKVCLRGHIYRSHKDVALKCEYLKRCGSYFKTEEERQTHYQEVHVNVKRRVTCPYCEKIYSDKVIYSHCRTHHPGMFLLKCSYHNCSIYFKSEEEQLVHVQEAHEKDLDEKRRCLYCGKFVLREMYYHVLKYHKDAIKCNFKDVNHCRSYFKTVEERDKHVREVHQDEKTSVCPYCKDLFKGEINLKSHVERLHKHLAPQCPHCKKMALKSHEKRCFRCNAKIACWRLRKAHNRKCLFKCPVCPRKFKRRYEVADHCKKMHKANTIRWRGLEHKSSGFKCTACFAYYKNQNTLRSHIATNHKVSCDFCRKRFKRKGALKNHIIRFHL